MALDPFNLEKSFPCPECGHVDSGRGFFTWDMDGKKGSEGSYAPVILLSLPVVVASFERTHWVD